MYQFSLFINIIIWVSRYYVSQVDLTLAHLIINTKYFESDKSPNVFFSSPSTMSYPAHILTLSYTMLVTYKTHICKDIFLNFVLTDAVLVLLQVLETSIRFTFRSEVVV